jgi:DNA helicase II / ATP-dependent DNA helicase PcrA
MLQLNKEQTRAAQTVDGATLVVAGAGSGKTRVITARIVHLISNLKIDPRSIIALTFTNKAAREMKERISSMIPDVKALPFVGTFHSYCLRLLRSNPQISGESGFSIMDSDDQASVIRKLSKKYGLEKSWTTGKIVHMISSIKNKLPNSQTDHSIPRSIQELHQIYEKEKSETNSLDFDDLILKVMDALDPRSSFAERLRISVRHMLVDEYQDTNEVQHEWLKRLALNPDGKLAIDSICAVGDQDQSIYSWRGAIAKNMDHFKKDFSPVGVVKIEQNYRSVQPILQAANKVIGNNSNRTEKKLWSELEAKDRILNVACKNEYQESDITVQFTKNTIQDGKSVGILYRTHAQSRLIEEALISNGIPYKIFGGLRFYERMEIKDLLAYLRLIHNPFDRVSFFRALNKPARGLGEKCAEELSGLFSENPKLNFVEIIDLALQDSVLFSGKRAIALKELADNFRSILNKHHGDDESDLSPSEILDKVLKFTNYKNYLRTSFEAEEATTKIQNVDELIRSVSKFEERTSKSQIDGILQVDSKNPALDDFLHEVALVQAESKNHEGEKNPAQLMTLHSAKGLEFNTVIMTGNENGMFPSARSLENRDALEEERRLFYVGMTRAKQRLILIRAHTRNRYGRTELPEPSRFLEELPGSYVKDIDAVSTPMPMLTRSIKEWLLGGPFVCAKPFFKQNANNVFGKTMIKTSPKISANNTAKPSVWCKNRTVSHVTFGPGVVTDVKKMTSGDFCLTVAFKSGPRKILSKFLTMI